MTTYALVHPKHGTHFVYIKEDVKNFEKQGWTLLPDAQTAQLPAVDLHPRRGA